jgi:hypothetical protein
MMHDRNREDADSLPRGCKLKKLRERNDGIASTQEIRITIQAARKDLHVCKLFSFMHACMHRGHKIAHVATLARDDGPGAAEDLLATELR